MVNLLTLDARGALLASAFGAAILFFGQEYGPLFLGDIVIFLALSAIVTRIGKRRKSGIGVYENTRGWKNVLSNGAAPVAVVMLFRALGLMGMTFLPLFVILVYTASLAAVTADKFSSELGVLDGEPTMLLTLKKVKKGTSGGVTGLGLLSSALGAVAISATVLPFAPSIAYAAIPAACGFIGGIVDSVLGYYEEEGIGNKYTSNFFCSVAGAAACVAMLLV